MTNSSLLKQQHVFLLSHQDSAAASATGRFALGGGLPALNCVRRATNLRVVFRAAFVEKTAAIRQAITGSGGLGSVCSVT